MSSILLVTIQVGTTTTSTSRTNRQMIDTKIHHHCLEQFMSRNQARIPMSHHLFQAQQLNGHEQKKWHQRNVLSLFVPAATKEISR
jgi:hypothetical protein